MIRLPLPDQMLAHSVNHWLSPGSRVLTKVWLIPPFIVLLPLASSRVLRSLAIIRIFFFFFGVMPCIVNPVNSGSYIADNSKTISMNSSYQRPSYFHYECSRCDAWFTSQ